MDIRILPETLAFEWDGGNNEKNFLKHGLSNKECEDVFGVNEFLLLKDQAHSTIEDRYLVIGPNKLNKILVLAITLRGTRVRIISGRPASKKERIFYEKTFKTPKIQK
ncbi:MAG: BrnT family toxin [Patescibacteria group bacterium]